MQPFPDIKYGIHTALLEPMGFAKYNALYSKYWFIRNPRITYNYVHFCKLKNEYYLQVI